MRNDFTLTHPHARPGLSATQPQAFLQPYAKHLHESAYDAGTDRNVNAQKNSFSLGFPTHDMSMAYVNQAASYGSRDEVTGSQNVSPLNVKLLTLIHLCMRLRRSPCHTSTTSLTLNYITMRSLASPISMAYLNIPMALTTATLLQKRFSATNENCRLEAATCQSQLNR